MTDRDRADDTRPETWQSYERQAARRTPGDGVAATLPPDAEELLRRLGFDPPRREPCCGYANACVCGRCADRQERYAALGAAGMSSAHAAVAARRESADAIARGGVRKGPRI